MKRILPFDGGGMWGLPVAMLCEEVERRLQTPLARHFDLLAGTSTGGLLALALACEIPASELVRFYLEDGPRIFRLSLGRRLSILRQAKYAAGELERSLKTAFRARVLRDCRHRVLVTSADVRSKRTKIFKSWQDQLIPLWEAGRCTSAAPTFFEPYVGLVDGGVWANNPSMVALTEARLLWPGEALAVLNLGTGQFARETRSHRTWGLFDWGPVIADLFLESGFDAATYMAMTWADSCQRIDFSREGANPAMDDASGRQLERLREIGHDHARRAKDVLDFLGRNQA
jgi:patatin-like phospholipase/acyl hydrolase